MANLLDYLEWRGDLTMEQSPLNDVDALVLSRAAYLPFEEIVAENFLDAVSLGKAAGEVAQRIRPGGDGRTLRLKEDERLIKALENSPRFCEIQACGYVNLFRDQAEEQFSAITFLLPDERVFVAFRGTDGTIVGWKEDFNMGFSDTVPAQVDAVSYLEAAAQAYQGRRICVAGHSKGGNLAVYAAAFCDGDIQKRILSVCNNDGPGFSRSNVEKEGFFRILPRVKTYLPQSSVVGMLLEHEEDFCVVHSTNTGLSQHDVYSWQVRRSCFETMSGFTNSSQFVDATLKSFVKDMPPARREKLVDGTFAILAASEGKTLKELWNGKNTLSVLRAVSSMDMETKQVLTEALKVMQSSAKKSFPAFIEKISRN